MGQLPGVPYLEGWRLVSDVAREIGVSRQAIYDAVERSGKPGAKSRGMVPVTLRKIGELRPVYVIRDAEVEALKNSISADAQRRGRMARSEESSDEDQASPAGDAVPPGSS